MAPYKYVLFAFGLLGFVWLPSNLGKWLWFLVAYFIVINAGFLLQNHDYAPSENLWTYLLLSQGPWLVVLADLVFKGRLARLVQTMPYRQLLLFEATRLMGLHFLMSARDGEVPIEFAAEACLGETLSAVCALILFLAAKKSGGGFRMGLLVWNTYGLASLVSLELKLFHANPFMSPARYSREIFQYMTDYPQAWLTFFWMPLAMAGHLAVYYKMIHERWSAHRDHFQTL